jgi:hypothetical protein
MTRSWSWRRARRISLVLLGVYLLVVSCASPADHLILFPSTRPIDAGPAVQRDVDCNGLKIDVWTAQSPAVSKYTAPAGFVLEFTGNATRAEQIAQYVADRWKHQSIEAWVMNYPGYGQSEGGAKLKLIAPAALATYDALAKIADGRPIFLEANSLGTAAALCVAARRPIAGLVLQNPPPLQRLLVQHDGWWNLWLVAGPVALQIPSDLNSLTNGPKCRAPAVFLTADHDTLVPPYYHRLVIDAYAGPKRVITMTGKTHWDSVTGDDASRLDADIAWLWSRQASGNPLGTPTASR